MQTQNIKQSLTAQGVIGLVTVALFAVQSLALPALYGFFIGLVNLGLLALTFKKANQKAAENPKTGILVLYMSAVFRFILLAVLFVLGMSYFNGEEVFPIALTFVLMQLGQLFNLRGKRRLTD